MKKSLPFVLFLAVGSVAITASASVSIAFSTGVPPGNVLSGFGNASGVATNGMRYGIVVDTGGNGFNAGSYIDFNVSVGGFLSTSSGVTDDYFWSTAGGNSNDSGLTFDSTGFSEIGGGVGGAGTVFDITEIPFGGASGIGFGQAFRLIWFVSNSANAGDRYGMFGHPSFTIPSDGGSVDLSSNFGTTDGVKTASFTIAPEPSRAVLVGLGVLGMVFRRRRH